MTDVSGDRPLRVIQWATGALGRSAIRAVLERPDLELAGVRVFDPAKDGIDAGTLAGRPETGVGATLSTEALLDLDADCVVYAPAPGGAPFADLDTVHALLASGKNVVATTGYVYPHAHGPGLVDALEDSCARGGSSLHGCGVNPGFMSDLVPLVLSRLSRQITHVFARECSDFSGHPSPRMLRDLVGLGRDEEEFGAFLRRARPAMRTHFGESLHLVAAGLGLAPPEVDTDVAYRVAAQDVDVATGTIRAGTVAAVRWTFSAMVGGRPVIGLETVYKAGPAVAPEWGRPGYSVRVEGRPSITLTTGEDWVTNGIAAAAAHAVNAVPVVCAAPPGVRTFLDLPPVLGRASVHHMADLRPEDVHP
ncbi:NAD(P)H-dependent amine dehydrogenase family protein [Actinomadura harenae]|uniref:Dihydrodipicolinate reductase n=1 Tax=Actinomadura harenae TaxID=2483351 RepID=A0A3M2LQA6_9ACTN|nr:dihydrodipicolinate reductase [Actinomadura harenae]RMI38265.1 dihydrodipicolinate reductase [Actinomadura harenae]